MDQREKAEKFVAFLNSLGMDGTAVIEAYFRMYVETDIDYYFYVADGLLQTCFDDEMKNVEKCLKSES